MYRAGKTELGEKESDHIYTGVSEVEKFDDLPVNA